MVELSRDAQKLLSVLYETYQARRKAGMSKLSARDFQADKITEICEAMGWQKDDVLSTEGELRKTGFIVVFMQGACRLEDPAVVYMENHFKNSVTDALSIVSETLDIVSKLKI